LKESFSRGVFYAAAANVAYAAMQWGVITVLAKGVSLALLGEYSYAMAIIAPVLTFLNLNLRAVQVADYQGRHSFADDLGLRLSSTLLGCLLWGLLGVVLPGSAGGKLSFVAIGLLRSAEGLMDISPDPSVI
jgi:hypothetical protein